MILSLFCWLNHCSVSDDSNENTVSENNHTDHISKSFILNSYRVIKYRWFFELICNESNVIIARAHKRPFHVNEIGYKNYDFFNTSSCKCGNCTRLSNYRMDYGLTLLDIIELLGSFKELSDSNKNYLKNLGATFWNLNEMGVNR